MSVKPYLIGIDVGTMGTRSAIFSTDGNLIAMAFEASKLYYPRPSWVEQYPDEIYQSVAHTIKECLEKSGISPSDVAAISLDGQMAGIGTVDLEWGTPTVYDSWLDTRCEPYIDRMKEHRALIIAKTGGPPTYCHGPKILWWLNESPQIRDSISKFVVPAGYVAGRMAGLKGEEAFIDYTYLHFSCLADTEAAVWDEELCTLFEVPMEKLPRIVKPWDIIGGISPQAARDCGLLAGTPIAAGAGDQAAGMLGAGMVEPGMVFDVAGTASIFSICVDRFIPDLKHKTFFAGRLVPQDLRYALAYINGGGLNLRWFRDELGEKEREEAEREGKDFYAFMDQKAAAVPSGSERLLFLPHLGGRVCPNDPDTRGLWLGFTWAHKKEHFYRALLESVAYEYAFYLGIQKELFPHLQFIETRVIGGGAASPLWNQIKADVLNLPYVLLNRQEHAVLGSAIIAGYAVGLFDDLIDTAKRFVQPVSRVEPRVEYHLYYQPLVKQYLELFDQLRDSYKNLAGLPDPPKG